MEAVAVDDADSAERTQNKWLKRRALLTARAHRAAGAATRSSVLFLVERLVRDVVIIRLFAFVGCTPCLPAINPHCQSQRFSGNRRSTGPRNIIISYTTALPRHHSSRQCIILAYMLAHTHTR